jgi:hypothetical protein
MFNNDITLAGTSLSKTYSLISVSGSKSIRTDATAPLGEPRTLTVSHQQVSRSGVTADRHLIRIDHTISGVAPAPDVVISAQLVIEVPRETATAAQVQDVVDLMESFTGTAGYITKILNNEP